MKNELIIPIHEAVDKEIIAGKIRKVGVKGLDMARAEELGLMRRISNLLCAMHSLTMASHMLYGEVDYLFGLAGAKRHEIKKACSDFENAYDRWFSFWRGYQTADSVQEMNNVSADFLEQFMRWSRLPVHWELGDPQDAPGEREPLIEIERGDRIWRLYRDVARSETSEFNDDEWAVMCSDTPNGNGVMSCVQRGMDKSSAMMSAKRMSANDNSRLYVACKFEEITERRLEVVPFRAYMNGEKAGDVKSVIRENK